MEVRRRLLQYHFLARDRVWRTRKLGAVGVEPRILAGPDQGGACLERAEAGARATGPQAPGLSRFGPKVPRNFGGSKGLPNLAEKSSKVEEFRTEFGGGFWPGRPGLPYLYPPPSAPCQATAPPCLVHGDNAFDHAASTQPGVFEGFQNQLFQVPDRAAFFDIHTPDTPFPYPALKQPLPIQPTPFSHLQLDKTKHSDWATAEHSACVPESLAWRCIPASCTAIPLFAPIFSSCIQSQSR